MVDANEFGDIFTPELIVKSLPISYDDMVDIYWNMICENGSTSLKQVTSFLTEIVVPALSCFESDRDVWTKLIDILVEKASRKHLELTRDDFEYIVRLISTLATGKWHYGSWNNFLKKLFLATTKRQNSKDDTPFIAHFSSELRQVLYSDLKVDFQHTPLPDLIESLNMVASLSLKSHDKMKAIRDVLQSQSDKVESNVDDLFRQYIDGSSLTKESSILKVKLSRSSKAKKLTKKQVVEQEKKKEETLYLLQEEERKRREEKLSTLRSISFSFRPKSEIHNLISMIPPLDMKVALKAAVDGTNVVSGSQRALLSDIKEDEAVSKLSANLFRMYDVNPSPLIQWSIYATNFLQVVWRDSESNDRVALAMRPNNFLILGPPCSGKNKLAQYIQNHYNSVYINLDSLLLENYDATNEMGSTLRNTFSDVVLPQKPQPPEKPKKKAVSRKSKRKVEEQPAVEDPEPVVEEAQEEEVVQLPPPSINTEIRSSILVEKLQSPEVQHRGYVLCGSSYISSSPVFDVLCQNLPKYIIVLECSDSESTFRLSSIIEGEHAELASLEEELSIISSELDASVNALKDEYSKLEEKYKLIASGELKEEEEEEAESEPVEEEEEYELDENGEQILDDEGNPIPKKKKLTIDELNTLKKKLQFKKLVLEERLVRRSIKSTFEDEFLGIINRVSTAKPGVIRMDVTLQDTEELFNGIVQTLSFEAPIPSAYFVQSTIVDGDEEVEAEEDDVIQNLQEKGIMFSPYWKKFCPVAYKLGVKAVEKTSVNDEEMEEDEATINPCPPGLGVPGDFKYAVVYRSHIYYTHNEEAAKLFCSNPTPFLTENPLLKKNILVLGNCTITSHVRFIQELKDEFPQYGVCSLDYFITHGEKSPAPQEDEQEAVEEDDDAPKKKVKKVEAPTLMLPIFPEVLPTDKLGNGCFIDATNYSLQQIEKLLSDRVFPAHVLLLETPEPVESDDMQDDPQQEEEGEEEGSPTKMNVEESSDGIPDFFKKYSTYKEHIDGLLSKLEEVSIPSTIISATEDKITSTILNQARVDFDPFTPIASPVEPPVALPLGRTGKFCPVTLRKKGLLQEGSEEIAASYKNQIFYFNSEGEREQFILNPLYYSTNISIPPPSFWVCGIPVSGKSEFSEYLSKEFDIPIIKLDEEFLESFSEKEGYELIRNLFSSMRYVAPKAKVVNEDGEEEDAEEEPDEEAVALKKKQDLINIFYALLECEPFKSKGYVFDGTPLSTEDIQILIRGSFSEENDDDEPAKPTGYLKPLVPSLVLSCNASSKVYVSRKLPSLLKDTEDKRVNRILHAEKKRLEKEAALRLKRTSEDEEEEEADEEEDELPDKAAIEDSLNEEHSEMDGLLTTLVDFLKEARVPVLELNGGKPKRVNFNRIYNAATQYTTTLERLFANIKPISHDQALQKLKSGLSYLNLTYGYEDGVLIHNTRTSFFTSTLHPILRQNTLLVRVSLLDGKKIISSFSVTDSLNDIQTYINQYLEATQATETRYMMEIAGQVFEEDGSGFWYNFQPNETLKENIRRVRSLKRKSKSPQTLFDRGYAALASSTIPLEVTLQPWVERIEEPKLKKPRTEEDGEDEDDPEEEDEEEEIEDEEEEETEPEYELDDVGEPLLDEEGNPIPKKKPQPPELSYPVLFDNLVYFFNSEENRQSFINYPFLYENIHGPFRTQSIPESHSPRVSVLGSDDARRESISRCIASQMRIEYVSLEEAYQLCLQRVKISKFAADITKMPLDALSENEILSLIITILNTWRVKFRGFVLNGLPQSKTVSTMFSEKNIDFHRVVFLSQNGELEDLEAYYREQFLNVYIPALDSLSMWKISGTVEEMTRRRISKACVYKDLINANAPAPIHDIGMQTTEFRNKLSKYKAYCPVSFVERELLVEVDDPLRTFGVEYEGKIYLMKSQAECEKFLANPKHYTSSRYELPNDLPERVHVPGAGKDIEEENEEEVRSTFTLQGFDAVLLKTIQEDGEPILVRGNSLFVARYRSLLYRFHSESNLKLFLSQPWLYADSSLPTKIPLRKSEYQNLGILQYLEESMQRIVSKGLIELNRERPLHPGMNSQKSAVEFIALFLKRMNPENNVDAQKNTDEAFGNFIQACDIARRLTLKEPVSESEKELYSKALRERKH